MDISASILSQITIYTKYARFLKEKNRRETWEEICQRSIDMHIKRYPYMKEEIERVYKDFVLTKKVLPSMRAVQFAGKPIELMPSRMFNCSFMHIDDVSCFSEAMFLLLGGTGLGYSVQKKHVEKLPAIRKPRRTRRYLIGDSIEGWSDSIKVLISAYMKGKSLPIFDFSDIREKGAPLVTSGGKAPGPQPLKDCLYNLQKILDNIEDGEQLTPLHVHDMLCFIADAVLAGGIRRAALISLFDMDDEEMLGCKSGNWSELNPQRGRANNSAVVVRHKIDEDRFRGLMNRVKLSGCGEPGIFLTNNEDYGLNPCGEVSIKSNNFCNLTTINASDVISQDDYNARAKAASFIGTLQASYTNFHYLRDVWRRNAEKDALLGVSMTGIASGAVDKLNISEAAKCVVDENKRVAKLLSIKPALRTTCVKPEGTASCVLGTSSGIHAWHDKYYIRRMRLGKNESLYYHMFLNHYQMLEDDFFKPNLQSILSVPIKAPESAVTREESALDLLNRIKRYYFEWVKPGHIKGDNTHNISATVSIKDDGWDDVIDWTWSNRDSYSGLTFLPHSNHSYVQAPFESCSKEKYEEMMKIIENIDLSKVVEIDDDTNLKGEVACGGGSCELA